MVRHAVYLLCRFACKAIVRLPYEELHMARFRAPALEFAEAVLAHKLEEGRDKVKDSWEAGICMGRVTTTGERIVGCPTGILKVRSVRRRPESLQ